MGKIEFKNQLINEMNKLGYSLNEEQQEQFYKYIYLLLEWNEKINLTAITETNEIIIKHLVDSSTIKKYINEEDKIVDIGTGAGFPGIPLKILEPSAEITLVDSLNKRINFLNEVIEQTELNNIEAIHSRAEDFGKNKNYRENYDIAVSRAVARLNVLVEYLMPTVKKEGLCICMKGPDAQEEINEAKNAIKMLGGKIEKIEEFNLSDTDIRRTIIIIKKEKETPKIYPRKAGVPAKTPLK